MAPYLMALQLFLMIGAAGFCGFALARIIQIRKNLNYLDKIKEQELWRTEEGRAKFDGIMECFRETR